MHCISVIEIHTYILVCEHMRQIRAFWQEIVTVNFCFAPKRLVQSCELRIVALSQVTSWLCRYTDLYL